MLGRVYRFHGHNGLSFVYKRGVTVRNELCSIRTVSNARRTDYRVAVVVSKKVAKSAVVRNRIRRRIFEIVRMHSSRISQSLDIVVTVFASEVATIPAEELATSIEKLLVRAKVIAKSASSAHATIESKEN